MRELWLQTDEREDVLASLRHCIASFELAKDDLHAFKWVILSLHSALQGACVCHLVTTAAPIGPLTNKATVEWLAYFEASRRDPNASKPKTKIAELPDLLKRIRKPDSAGDRAQGSSILVSDVELEWWSRIHREVRNQFVHFAPMGWSVEMSGIPELAWLTSRIIGDISARGWAFRHQSDEWRNELDGLLQRLASR